MATLILGTVGRIVGGPLGGLVGTVLGSALDRSLLGGGKTREVGRVSNLAVQSSAYGEPIPRLYGRMRVAGNLVWTAGIAEHSSTSGGGKRGGAKTTSYTYSASFAVILSGRAVVGIGRVWADGKLLRDAAGTWITPATMRLHTGGDGQAVDPLIAAAEGAGGAPGYRGLAYAVFEDLPLADYGNRIPNLTFELVADASGTDAGEVVGDLCAAGHIAVDPAGIFPSFGGFAATRGGSVREQIGQLTELYDLRFVDDGTMFGLRAGPVAASVTIAADDLGSHDASSSPHEARTEARGAGGQLDDAVALGFFDPARDYQPGLQRSVRRADASRIAQVDIAAAFAADTAKGLAGALLARRNAARVGATFQLPPRSLDLRAGTAVRREGDATSWSVRRWTFANFVSELAVERQPVRLATAAVADPGRVHDAGDSAAGATVLHLLDLPPLFGEVAPGPRLYVAGAGASPGWRRSGIALSLDGGETYAVVGEVGAPSIIGVTASTLATGSADRWDREGRVEVELLGDTMWLDGRSEAAVLAGANLAVFDDEIVQFANVEALGGRRFTLSTLLRGRRASAVAAHPSGARFVVLDPERLFALDLGPEVVGRSLRVRATGTGDGTTPPVAIDFAGVSARPLPPVLARCVAAGGDAVFAWTRRSRSGFAWLDGVDAPLGESAEGYRVEVRRGVTLLRALTVAAPEWRYLAADRAADATGAGIAVTLTIAQLGDLAGLPVRADFILS